MAVTVTADVALAVAVEVGVALAVAEAVAVAVAVGVGVAVAVGFGRVPFATPLNLTGAFALPLVPSLVMKIESRNAPAEWGAKSAVTKRGEPFD